MKLMFVPKTDGELTQVDFWNLYKDVFTPYHESYPALGASDVIKSVNVVFPQAQAMVLPGSVQRFVVRGVDRRKEDTSSNMFRCQWRRSQCSATPYNSPGELYEHLLEHIAADEIEAADEGGLHCLWATCPVSPLPKASLRAHVLTHLSSSQPLPKHPTQDDTITLPSVQYPYPMTTPTTRPPPPPRKTTITYRKPILDPPSSSLTALLCIRILFRTSFISTDEAPRVDADHFGFPGFVEDVEGIEEDQESVEDSEKEGEKRGRKAFVGVRRLMEKVQIRDETLMSWIAEMVDAGISGTTM
jgi:chromatin structure-remodeling complex subunit RSC9